MLGDKRSDRLGLPGFERGQVSLGPHFGLRQQP